MRNNRHILLLAGLMMLFSAPAAAQLAGSDTTPGSSCAGFPAGAARVTADADQDGKEITLVCDGTTWNATDGLWSKNGSDIYYNSGNVGIGATAPGNIPSIWDAGGSHTINPRAFIQEADSGIYFAEEYSRANIYHFSFINTIWAYPKYIFGKAYTSQASPTDVSSGDYLGEIQFTGYDGNYMTHGASIMAEVSGTVNTKEVPTSLVFSTATTGLTAPSERMRIADTGDISMSGTGALKVHAGTTAERPGSAVNGMIRYNSTTDKFEAYENSAWTDMIGGSSGTPAGADTQIQFNSNGAFGANANFVYTAAGDFIVGSYQLDDTGTGSEDNRMFFDVSKGAFRAGNTEDTRWNAGSVGNYSFAAGSNNNASGTGSAAFGIWNQASGYLSAVFGESSLSGGNHSFSAGYNADAQGQQSVAFGRDVWITSTGNNSAAFGLGDTSSSSALVSGVSSFGIFMGDQSNVDLAATKTMGLFGGKMVIDPAVPATQLSARGVIDVGAATDAIVFPRGTTADRPGSAVNGMIRYNSTTDKFEAYENSAWTDMIGGSGGTPAGADTQIQFNSNGSFGANAGFVWDDANERLGIGTATPSKSISIVADDPDINIDYSGTPTSSYADIYFNGQRSSVSYERATESLVLKGDTDANGLGSLFLYGKTSGIVVKNNGDVGIGTTSPAAKLDVSGEAKIGYTGLSCSGTTEGAIRYNSSSAVMEFCNGTSWTVIAQVQSASGPTAPAGSGYFVLTHTTWNGNLGGLAGADAKCLTELGTTYTSWRGYSTANSNGQITASKVHAFLCERYTCNNLMPLTTYYFAYANDGTPGGASFTTDASGFGPNDSVNWSAANYFSGTYSYWTGRDAASSTLWSGAIDDGYASCNADWSDDGTSSYTGNAGNSGQTDDNRWYDAWSDCSQTKRLICFVNP